MKFLINHINTFYITYHQIILANIRKYCKILLSCFSLVPIYPECGPTHSHKEEMYTSVSCFVSRNGWEWASW